MTISEISSDEGGLVSSLTANINACAAVRERCARDTIGSDYHMSPGLQQLTPYGVVNGA